MKLFKEQEQHKKTFSVKVKEVGNNIDLTLVDSETGEHIANICKISDDGIYISTAVNACIDAKDYDSTKIKFEIDGSLKIIKH
jgi:hypothetical protein